MNPYEFFRARVGALISHGFAVDAIRTSLDLKGASEVWGGPDTDDRAAWYFWLTPVSGAYRLRLMHADVLDGPRATALYGVFSVNYYPFRYEPVYRHFSRREQALIASNAFDETNTPRVEALAEIPDRLFSVALIKFTHDPDCGQTFLTYTSLDMMRFHDPTPAVRELPSWDVGYPLFDAVAGLQAFLGRRRPKRVVLSRQPGFEFVETADEHLEDRDSIDAEFKSLLIAFHPKRSGARSAVEDRIIARHTAEPWTPLLDTATHMGRRHGHAHDRGNAHAHEHDACACGHDHRRASARSAHTIQVGGIEKAVPLAFNTQWWALADADQSAPTMPCGCH